MSRYIGKLNFIIIDRANRKGRDLVIDCDFSKFDMVERIVIGEREMSIDDVLRVSKHYNTRGLFHINEPDEEDEEDEEERKKAIVYFFCAIFMIINFIFMIWIL